jgi:hypothetical protein
MLITPSYSHIFRIISTSFYHITRHECGESDRESWFRVRKTLEVC